MARTVVLASFGPIVYGADTLQRHPLVPLAITQVKVDDPFWGPRIEVNNTRTLQTVRQHLIETGAIDNFALASGKKTGKFRGPFWSDSDVYKWLEGASYALASRRDADLEAKVDKVISSIGAAQMKDGYLDTYFQLVYPDGKWTFLGFGHEDFCAGHMYEAAVAHYEATGKRSLLDIAIRHANHVDSIFGPGKRAGQPGHEVIELALVKLYRVTGDQKYLDLARFFLDQRGQKPSFFEGEYGRLDPNFRTDFLGRTIGLRTLYDEFFRKDPARFDTQYSQDHLPVRQQDKVVGHAVRAAYLYSGMADVAGETHDQAMFDALLRLFKDLTTKRMYVTGGIGPSAENEGFTRDYDLPNETAYQETCASIAVAMWAQRMLALTRNSRFADTMELSLYNGFLSGVSLAGDTFFYDNVLYSRGQVARKDWFVVPCCPTNVARILPSIGYYAYSQSPEGLWVNLYLHSTATVQAGKNGELVLSQKTSLPAAGTAHFTVTKAPADEYGVFLRIPGWAGKPGFKLNGKPVEPAVSNGYAALRRRWASGDTIDVDFPLEIQRLEANPNVLDDRGRTALRRGPFIYCFEQADNQADIDQLVLSRTAPLEAHYDAALLNGVAVITGKAMVKKAGSWDDQLYRPTVPEQLEGPVPVRAVPYCTWANRGLGKMAVWVDETR
jgi:uncharacterized protein